MSDPAQPPPTKPKPGSLRDRIAAFEKPTSSSSAPKPPPIRPKPGNVSWKPAPPSPPENATTTPENEEKKHGGMSASDAKDSIGKGGSLKERMAALQGRGAFGGGISPSPPPIGPKPVKRPPLVVSPPPMEEVEEQAKELGDGKSLEQQGSEHHEETEKRHTSDSAHAGDEDEAHKEEKEEGAEEEQDEEAKERERRAAIAARMARLGGARVGMAPPVFGKKLEVKEKPKVASVPDTQPNDTSPLVTSEKSTESVSEPSVTPEIPAMHRVPTPEVKETGSDVPRIVADEDVTSKETRAAPLPPASLSSPTSDLESPPTVDSESQPILGTSSSHSSLVSSRSPPPSMPIPAAPRRTGPPRSKSARNMKAEAKKQDQESPEVLLVSTEAQADFVEAPIASPPTQQDPSIPAGQESGQEHEVNKEHDITEAGEAADEQIAYTNVDSEDNVAAPAPTQAVQEYESAQEVPKFPEEPVQEGSHVVAELHTLSQTNNIPSNKMEVEQGASTAEVPTTETSEAIAEAPEPEEDESQGRGLPESEITMSGQQGVHFDPLLSDDRDVEGTVPTNHSSEPSPVVEAGVSAVSAPEHTEEPEEKREIAPVQVRADTEQLQEMTAMEEPAEDEEVARRKRIAERMAKMGGRNPFAASPFGVAGPRKVSGDESHEPVEVVSHEASIAVEQDHENTVPKGEALVEAAVNFDSHEVDGQEPRVSSVVEEQHGGVPTTEDSFEEHEAIDPEHKPYSHPYLPHSGPEKLVEIVETVPPEQGGLQASEEADEMAPPRITRAVPPPPPQAPVEEPAVSPVDITSNPISRHPIPPPPEEDLSIVEDPPTSEDEDEVRSEVQRVSPDQMELTPPTPTPLVIPSVMSVQRGESERDSPSPSPTLRRSIPSPPRAVPAVPSTTGSTEFRSPISPSSRKSLPPPPRVDPVPSNESDHTAGESSPSTSPPRRAVSPPARRPPIPQIGRPVSPDAVPRRTSVRRSIPPPPSHTPPQAVEGVKPPPPRRVPSQPGEEVASPPTRRAPSHDELQTADSPAPDTKVVPRDSIEEQEILAESEPDPIDPAFYSPPRTPATPRDQHQPSFTSSSREASGGAMEEEDAEQTRQRTIAERMAKLGGIKFGAPPPPPTRKFAAPPPEAPSGDEVSQGSGEQESHAEDSDLKTDAVGSDEPDTEETERARRQAIAARLAGMGGMRFGMLPHISTPTHPRGGSDDSARTAERLSPPPPPQQLTHAPPPPPVESATIDADLESVSDEGVKVEAGSEMSMEEVNPEDAEEDAEEVPPPVPSRSSRQSHTSPSDVAPPLPGGKRPPVPTSVLPNRPPVPRTGSKRSSVSDPTRKTSGSATQPVPSSGDFVIVDEEEELPPPPPPPRSRPPRTMPPPVPVSKDIDSSPWELPEIPRGSFDVNVGTSLGMEASISLEDSTTYPSPFAAQTSAHPVEPTPTPVPAPVMPAEVQLSSDELLELWGVVGKAVHAAAASSFDKSKKSLVGDGTSQGFVNAVLVQVPQASKASYGHLIYSQKGNSVLRRSSMIMPGDIVQLTEAKLKGHKGLQSYHQTAGTVQEPLYGIVSEFDGKKSKMKVFQANQHVGSQTVEAASYRLDDLKSGSVKVFRAASI